MRGCMEKEIKPCPYAHKVEHKTGKVSLQTWTIARNVPIWWFVQCEDCGACSPEFEEGAEEAITVWNEVSDSVGYCRNAGIKFVYDER